MLYKFARSTLELPPICKARIIRTSTKANLALSCLALCFWMVAFTCQIASPTSVAMLSVNNMGWDALVIPNPKPTSPFPIRAGRMATRTASLITKMFLNKYNQSVCQSYTNIIILSHINKLSIFEIKNAQVMRLLHLYNLNDTPDCMLHTTI